MTSFERFLYLSFLSSAANPSLFRAFETPILPRFSNTMVSTRSTSSFRIAKHSLDKNDSASKQPKLKKSRKGGRNPSSAAIITKLSTKDIKTETIMAKDYCKRSLREPLFRLGPDMTTGTLVCRPSKRNKSPYVADMLIEDENGERETIVHVPNLDMGGKCVPGVTLLAKPARDKKGSLVGPNAVSPKFGTPKCEYIAQLFRVDETALGYTPATWVGGHPTLGEKIAEQLIQRNTLHPHLPKVKSFEREVRNVCGADMRADFLIHFEDDKKHRPCVLEVKTVVDTDFAAGRVPNDNRKCVFVSAQEPYRRAGIFPWGQCNQKGPDGEKVVSTRAIKHVRELTKISRGELRGPNAEAYQAAVLFVVIRNDAEYFRPNHEACPSFCRYLKEAKDAGVTFLAKRVDWGDAKETIGQCYEGPLLEIEWPNMQGGRST